MKHVFAITLTFFSLITCAQDKQNYVRFNTLTEVSGTEFVIASMANMSKLLNTKGNFLLFINTKTGETNQVDFPNDAHISRLEQIKIDSLGINLVAFTAQTVDLDAKSGIDWNDPLQVIILSPDGKVKTQLTDSSFFARIWAVNKRSGTIVITGHYDTNSNHRYDKTDKNEIHIYDLKSFKLISKI